MPSLAVVVAFDVIHEVGGRVSRIGVTANRFGQRDTLALVRGHPAFHRSIVVRMVHTTHARFDPHRRQDGTVFGAGVLDAPVAVVEQTMGRPAMRQGHPQRPQDGGGGQALSRCPADDAATVQVHDYGHIEPTRLGAHIRQIGDPDLVGSGRRRMCSQAVGRNRLIMATVSSTWHEAARTQAA